MIRNRNKLGKSDRNREFSIPTCRTRRKSKGVSTAPTLCLVRCSGYKQDDSFVVCSKYVIFCRPAYSLKLVVNDAGFISTLNLFLGGSMAYESSDVVDLTVDSADEEEYSNAEGNALKRKVQSESGEPESFTSKLSKGTLEALEKKLPRLKPSPLLYTGFRQDARSHIRLALSQSDAVEAGSHVEQLSRIKSESSASPAGVEEQNLKNAIEKLRYENERLLSQNLNLKAKLLEMGSLYKSLQTDHRISMNKFADLRLVVDRFTISEKTFVADEEIVKSFTGLPTFDVLKAMYSHIESYMETSQYPITKFQQYILTLMCIRLNIGFDLLSHIFRLAVHLVSKIFTRVLQVMFARYSALVSWPSRENLFPSVPLLFRETFGQQIVIIVVTLELSVIIDSIEVQIEGSSKQCPSQATVVSDYRNQTYVKFLLGLSPQGAVLFISKGCGGDLSEKELVESSGLLQNLLPGDIVLGERGCSVYEVVEQKMKNDVLLLQPFDLNNYQEISNLKIHVERVVDIFMKSFKFWSSGLPVEFFNVSIDGPPAVDKMILVCCALNNASLTVVL